MSGKRHKNLAASGFDPPTSGLWAQHASTAPRCCPTALTKRLFLYLGIESQVQLYLQHKVPNMGKKMEKAYYPSKIRFS
uniref:Uncharacterized protein n=1 Tax=Onchocerca volvulus TaxID=6282 RepID=A0A8R1XZX5_ONCVO